MPSIIADSFLTMSIASYYDRLLPFVLPVLYFICLWFLKVLIHIGSSLISSIDMFIGMFTDVLTAFMFTLIPAIS